MTARVSADCYGTLVDWMRGLSEALRHEVGDRADRLLASTLAFAFALEAERPHRRYRDALTEGLRRAAAQEGALVGNHDVLIDAWPDLPIFGDVVGCLEELRAAGWRLGILTNCDDDLFAATAASIGVPFDETVTAEYVQSYKPGFAHFEEFQRRTGVTGSNWVHVANSWVADVVPTHELGIPCIWVNRDRDDNDRSLAAVTLPDFTGLTDELMRLLPP